MALSLGLAMREGRQLWEADQFQQRQREEQERQWAEQARDRERRRLREDFEFERLKTQAAREDAVFGRAEAERVRKQNVSDTVAKYQSGVMGGSTSAYVNMLNELDPNFTYQVDPNDKDDFRNGLNLVRINNRTNEKDTLKTTAVSPAEALSEAQRYMNTPTQNIKAAMGLKNTRIKLTAELAKEQREFANELKKDLAKGLLVGDKLLDAAGRAAALEFPGMHYDKDARTLVSDVEGVPVPEDASKQFATRLKAIAADYNNAVAGGDYSGKALLGLTNIKPSEQTKVAAKAETKARKDIQAKEEDLPAEAPAPTQERRPSRIRQYLDEPAIGLGGAYDWITQPSGSQPYVSQPTPYSGYQQAPKQSAIDLARRVAGGLGLATSEVDPMSLPAATESIPTRAADDVRNIPRSELIRVTTDLYNAARQANPNITQQEVSRAFITADPQHRANALKAMNVTPPQTMLN